MRWPAQRDTAFLSLTENTIPTRRCRFALPVHSKVALGQAMSRKKLLPPRETLLHPITSAVEPIDLAPQNAYQIALENRLDVMNNRAALVDSWRLIAFNADALQADLDVVFNGNMATSRNNPFSFDGSTGRSRNRFRRPELIGADPWH